jgi:hypothetical protein
MSIRLFDFEPEFIRLAQDGFADWADALRTACSTAIQPTAHGLLNDWKVHWHNLPTFEEVVLEASDEFALRGPISRQQSDTFSTFTSIPNGVPIGNGTEFATTSNSANVTCWILTAAMAITVGECWPRVLAACWGWTRFCCT